MAIRSLTASLLGLACAAFATGCTGQRGAAIDPMSLPKAVSPAAQVRPIDRTPFERLWDLRLGAPVHAIWQSPEVPGLLVVQLASRELLGIEAGSGDTRWATPPLAELVVLPPHLVRQRVPGRQAGDLIDDDRLYLVCQNELLCFDLGSGQVVWRWALPFSPSTGPCAIGTEGDLRVFLGDWRGYLRVVSLHPEKRFPYVIWQWNLGSAVTGQPLAREGQVYLGGLDGRVRSFQLDRAQAWESPVGGPVPGPVAARGRLLFAGTSDHVLQVLNRFSGEPLGQISLPGPVTRPVLSFDDRPDLVYAWVDAADGLPGGLAAIQARSDSVPGGGDAKKAPREVARIGLEWFMPGAAALVASTPGQLYLTLAGAPSRVLAVDRATGKATWAADLMVEGADRKGVQRTTAPVYVAASEDPHDLQRTLVVADEDGRLSCRRYLGYVPAPAVAR